MSHIPHTFEIPSNAPSYGLIPAGFPFELQSGYSVFVGKNNSGKSTLGIKRYPYDNTITIVQAQDEKEMIDLTYNLLGNSLGDLFFPSNFLIVEGASDQRICERVAELLNISNNKGDVVIRFEADIVDAKHASPEAVRIGENKFLDTKWLVPEAFINHSCSPNTYIDVKKYQYVAIKDIKKNEEITFDYVTTEYDMKKNGEDFKCECGFRNCYGQIKGFKYLTRRQKLKLKPYLTPYILKKFQQEE